MGTVTTTRKQELADRIMRIEQGKFLDQVEELLLTLEMQARVDQSMAEIERGEGISLEKHRTNAEAWIKAQRSA
jgi:hypothetical protein